MADVDYDDYGGYSPPSQPEGGPVGIGRTQRLINLAGAASSVALVVGLCVWGYNLAVRDVRGVPVMRALDGPMRIAPEDPGGRVADHQGLAVNSVAAVGVAGELADTLMLAPKATELDLDDEAGLRELPPEEPVVIAGDTGEGGLEPEAADAPTLDDPLALAIPAEGAGGTGVAAALADAMSDTAPLSAAADTVAVPESAVAASPPDGTTDAGTDLAVAEALAADPAVEGGMAKSLRPRLRPQKQAAAAAAPASNVDAVQATTSATPVPDEIRPEAIKSGTRLVQLGAFDSADQARGEWARLRARFPELLARKSLVVQSAESGGRTFWRLRAHGFDGEDDARRFCTAMLAEGATCIPVAQR